MREIIKNQTVLARLITENDFKSGLNFFSEDGDFLQVGVWMDYEKDQEINAHIHNIAERTIHRTYETIYVIRGCIEAMIYDLTGNYVDRLEIHQGDILTLLACGHGYKIKEDGTTVLEIKNGPYLGADIDRRRI